MRLSTACYMRVTVALAVIAGAAGVAVAQTTPRLPSYVVIQEVYAAGGERSSRYASDYVVLINRGTAAGPVFRRSWGTGARAGNPKPHRRSSP